MRRKALVLVILLLVLYMVPANVVATEYTTSDQSITSFSETLPDDVLFYPDSFGDFVADSGNATAVSGGTYASTHASDDVNWYVVANINSITYNATFVLEFDTGLSPQTPNLDIMIEYFFERSSGTGTFDDGGVQLYNHSSGDWNYIYQDVDWHGSEVTRYLTANSSGCISANGLLDLRVTLELTDGGGGTDFGFFIDYCHVSYMTLADSDHYAESFADVSDWTEYQFEGNDASSSDGDVVTIVCEYDAGNVYDRLYTNDVSITSNLNDYYFEFDYRLNETGYTYIENLNIYFYSEDDRLGDQAYLTLSSGASAWTTIKSHFNQLEGTPLSTVESIAIQLRARPGQSFEFYSDYMRFSRSTEMGWQHDGSTTTGVSSSDGGTITTDADLMTLTSDADGATFEVVVDTTATAAYLSCSYYPFLHLEVTSISSGDGFKLEQYDGAAWAYLQTDYATTAGTYRYNMRSLDTYVEKFRVTLTTTADLVLDFMQAYSIANFTVTLTGDSLDDILYTDSDILYCSATAITSIVLDHDPALSLNTTTIPDTLFSVTTSSGTPQLDLYIDAAWIGYTSETAGSCPSGMLTDLRIKFTDSANVAAITFLSPIPQWYEVEEVIIYFSVPYDYWGLNMILIFGGLILMLVSVCIVAVKVRDRTITQDSGMLFLVLFCVGWGLFIGGSLIG